MCRKKETRRMLMRRTIGISIAFLVISSGAMAASHDKATSNRPNHMSEQTAKTHAVSINPCGTRTRSVRHGAATRHRQVAARLAAHHDDQSAPPQLLGGREIGTAAWYNHVGSATSSGERLDTVTPTAAHRTLPLSSYAKVTHLDSGRSVIVKINDRGPWTRRFIIDLSPRAADQLNMRRAGVAAVVVEPVTGPTEAAGMTVVTQRSSAFVTQ